MYTPYPIATGEQECACTTALMLSCALEQIHENDKFLNMWCFYKSIYNWERDQEHFFSVWKIRVCNHTVLGVTCQFIRYSGWRCSLVVDLRLRVTSPRLETTSPVHQSISLVNTDKIIVIVNGHRITKSSIFYVMIKCVGNTLSTKKLAAAFFTRMWCFSLLDGSKIRRLWACTQV